MPSHGGRAGQIAKGRPSSEGPVAEHHHEFRSVRLMHMKNGNDATLLLTLQRLGRMVDEYGDIQRQKYSAGAPMDRPDDRPPPC